MYQELIEIYKNAFPDNNGQDAGYILRDGTIIDISKPFTPYCHGREFMTVPALVEWRNAHVDSLPNFPRPAIDAISQDIGAVQFTINNCHLQCVRLPNKPLGTEQKQALRGVISRILERGLVRVEVLGTEFYREFEAKDYDADGVMSELSDRI